MMRAFVDTLAVSVDNDVLDERNHAVAAVPSRRHSMGKVARDDATENKRVTSRVKKRRVRHKRARVLLLPTIMT